MKFVALAQLASNHDTDRKNRDAGRNKADVAQHKTALCSGVVESIFDAKPQLTERRDDNPEGTPSGVFCGTKREL